jgi:hypothetical protein
VSKFIEATVVLIVLYLVLSRALGFSLAISALAKAYTSSVRALQGR